jgi:methyl-accepting chemotaxis protein
MLKRNLTTLGFAALLAFIVAWVGGNLFLLRRINVLLRTAKRLEDGNVTARTGIAYGPGELSQLAHAFDRMAESLEQRIEEQKKAEEKIIQAKNDWENTFDNITDMITCHGTWVKQNRSQRKNCQNRSCPAKGLSCWLRTSRPF